MTKLFQAFPLFLTVFLLNIYLVSAQDNEAPIIMVMEIKADIDPRMTRYVELALDEARELKADAVVIEMDTYGGLVTDAKDIVEMLLGFEKPIVSFINKDAASAGALISIACDSIYMSKGASIGAATVVTQDGQAAPDKYQSYMRSTMRSTAESTGRDPQIAEAMVDEDIEIEGVTEKGKVLTFSTTEAIRNGFCEGEASDVEEVIETHFGLDQYRLEKFELPATEKIIAIFLNPFVSGILILVIVGGIYFELQTPGIGFPLLAAGIALILYFVPYYLNGLAEYWEIGLFFIGLILLALEIFVIPGFGIAGILGLLFTIGSLVLVMINNDAFDFTFVPMQSILAALTTALAGLLGSIILMFLGGVRLVNSRIFNRVALVTEMKRDEGYSSRYPSDSLLNKEGTAYTVLRPSGKVMIDDEVYDAYTRGEYIEAGSKIRVVAETGTSLTVREVK